MMPKTGPESQDATTTPAAPSAEKVDTQRLRALGALSAGVANEISGPALTLRCNLEVAAQGLRAHMAGQPLGVEAADHLVAVLEECVQATVHLQRVATTFSAFAQADPAARERVDLADLAHSAATLVRHTVQQRARLVVTTAPVPTVIANRGQLIQLLIALMHNAAEATPPDARDQHTIRLSVTRHDLDVVLVVDDDAAGMSPAVLDRATEPYFSAKRGHPGLGLTLAREIAAAHDGSLELRSSPGAGTRVCVRLPLPARPRRRSATPTPGPRLRVLLVDDDRLVRKVVARLLSREHAVTEADGGRAALALLEDVRFDVVVSDLMMPGLDGRALYTQATERWPELGPRFVFFTGGAVGDAMQRFATEMSERVASKDGGPLELVAHLSRHFAGVERLEDG